MNYYLLALLILLIVFLISLFSYYYFTGAFEYRLGDILQQTSYNNAIIVRKIYRYCHKDSIATEYLNRTNKLRDYDTLYEITKARLKDKYISDFDTLVVHLRVGDVIEIEHKGTVDQLLSGEKPYRYLKDYKYFEENLNKIKDHNINKVIIVGSSHRTKKRKKTNEYIDKIKKFIENFGYEVELRINNHSADEDFLFMANSKYFLRAGGGFSECIHEVVMRNEKISLSEF